ncbi:growth-regulating factor 3 [Silene latifolia]|uniref:growth-regulating factor 3 n=1 Tax=Silene latifolia TaxID=37657 RepID=UPI003D78B1B3
MDFSLKQWRDQQHESDDEHQQQPSAKIPRNHQHQQEQDHVPAALPLFVSEAYSSSTIPSSFPTSTPSFSMGGRNCFSIAQWQELEVQALIYRHMVAGATIPPDLLYLVKNSLVSSSPYYLHHYPPHFQPAALMQGGYWGKGGLDPEPGRCRRTDGKKWRCSRDIVAGHKYCERHVHRGRNRSRKPVEFPATAATGSSGGESISKPSATFNGGAVSGAARFSLPGSGAASFDVFQLHKGSEELRSDKKSLFDTQHDSASTHAKSNKVLMHFFDDWPRSLHDSDNPDSNGNNLSSTSLSISTPTPGNSTSDFLKLSTGNGDDQGNRDGYATADRDRGQISWTGAWAGNPVVSMGGPLAEALRSSSNSSPTGYHCSTPVA